MNHLTCSFVIFSLAFARSSTELTTSPLQAFPNSPPSCLPGWLNAQTEGCFLFLAEEVNLTWTEALSACENAGGYLAESKTQEQMDFLSGVAALEMGYTGVSKWWLGLTDLGQEGRWVWIHSLEKVSETFWNKNAPSDEPGNSLDCGFANLKNNNQLSWKDKDCGQTLAPICQYGEVKPDTSTTTTPQVTTTTSEPASCPHSWLQHEESCYFVIELELTWYEARIKCMSLGADLTSVHSNEQQSFISTLNGQKGWLGGSDDAEEGTWLWIDGTEFDYNYWVEGTTGGIGGTYTNCLLNTANNEWWDYGCWEEYWAICSKPI